MTNVLHAIATGLVERGAEIIAASDEIDDEEREVLGHALVAGGDSSVQARRLGDALRSIGAERHLINECYRVAFYTGEDWKALSSNPLYAFFTANRAGYPLDKWVHYFPIYQRHLEQYRGLPVRVLEIGVYRGGGLELLRHFLGPEARLVGIDIDESARLATGARHPVEIGDQADPDFLRLVSERHGPFDVVIDDGGHTMNQQIASVEALFPLLSERGTYLVEDCHTSYWQAYADQGPDGQTFIEWVKDRIDDLNAYHHSQAEELRFPWQTNVDGLHVYDSVVVLTKGRHVAPFSELSGTKEFVDFDRDTGALHLELLATRDVALARAAQADVLIAEARSQADEAIARAQKEQEQAAADVERSRLEVQGTRGKLVKLRAETIALRSDRDVLRAEHTQMSSDLLGAWGIIREMRRSMSWKTTAPLRRAKSVLGRRQ
jgi:cephalosporin hydroxylase